MNKAIVYSLFGYDRQRAENCFDFPSYLRHFMINLRLTRLLFPDWTIILETDKATFAGFENLFRKLETNKTIRLEKNNDGAPLCEAMLWRLKPVFWKDIFNKWEFSHILCRDLDSPPTYREAQAVQIWINHDKAMHAITDSVSHIVPFMGGMIGIRPDYFTERTTQTWVQLINWGQGMDLSRKGSDQDFLNRHIYPLFANPGGDSITQHYILGYGNTFLSDYHKTIEDIPLGIPERLKSSNDICGHIGAAGYYEGPLNRFLREYKGKFDDLLEIEKEYPKIFGWVNEQ